MTGNHLDVPYLLRQTAAVALLAALPFQVFAFASPLRRLLLPCSAVVLLVLTGAAFGLCAARTFALYGDGPPFPPPVRIGPSPFALPDLAVAFAISTWAPLLLVLASMWWSRQLTSVRVSLAFCTFTLAWCGFWQTTVLATLEHSHEDTVWADGFSTAGWAQVTEGMRREEVLRQIGPPLPTSLQPRFLPAAEFWVRNNSAGYWAALTFRDGVVVEKRWWYSD